MSSVTHRHNNSWGRVERARNGPASASLQPRSGIATSWQGWGEDTLLPWCTTWPGRPLADGFFSKLVVLTVTIPGVTIMGISHRVVKGPLFAQSQTQGQAEPGFLRRLGVSLWEKAHGFPCFKKLNDFVNLSPKQRCNHTVFLQ